MLAEPRRLLRAMFDAAVGAASPDLRVPAHLPPPPKGRTVVVGAGKASAAMAKAVEIRWPGPLTGLVVTRYGHAVPCERIEVVEASHPVPDENGRRAAARILEMVQGESGGEKLPHGSGRVVRPRRCEIGALPRLPATAWRRANGADRSPVHQL